jgi:tRNA threonylcarbamoyl adenosine modification protein YeaZ
MQLAIDTSTDTASLALVEDRRILAELTWRCGLNHTVQLLPNLNYLLEQNSTSLGTVDCVIVASGPGSYNGLRAGISTARGLAFSLGVPVIGISTLEVEAYQHAHTGLPVCAMLNAGREEIATATYKMEKGNWLRLEEEHLITLDSLLSQVTAKTLFCGEYAGSVSDEITGKLGEKAVIASPAAGLRRAGFLAELGLKRMDKNDFDNPKTLQPHYFRGPSITRPRPGKK